MWNDEARAAPEGKMTDPKHSDARPDIRRRLDASLDEARLRQQAIGVKLRMMFNEVVNEPVPDAFLGLLRSADERGRGEC